MDDTLGSLLTTCPTLAVLVMALTEVLGKGVPFLKRVPQQTISVVVGLALGALTHWFAPEWIPVGGDGVKGYVAAGFVGLAATVIAQLAHDRIWNAVLPSKVAEAYKKGPQS